MLTTSHVAGSEGRLLSDSGAVIVGTATARRSLLRAGPRIAEKRMPITGPLTHIDISIGYPERSIPFYSAFFQVLGYQRCAILLPEWQEPNPIRATWSLAYANGARFEVELRPARSESRDRKYDRYEPGLHHLAFHAESRAVVDRLFQVMREVGDTILDPPTDYGGQTGYDEGYYAVFLVDPDGMKLEVAYIPRANP